MQPMRNPLGSRMGTAILLAVLAGAAPGQTPPASQSEVVTPKAPPTVGGLDLSAIDQSADACTDFYQYACGNWVKENPVPEHQLNWVRSFSDLWERHLYELWQDLTRAATKPASALEKKYGDFFAACMDVEALQKKGLEPLKPTLERIAALTDSKSIATLMGELAAAGEPVGLFALDVESDPTDSTKPILSLSPGGLPLPGHLTRLFMQAGDTIQQTTSEEGAVVGIATKLARASTSGADSGDPDKRYHVLSLAELEKLAPHFDFRVYFNRITTRPIVTVNVTNPDYLQAVDELISSLPIDSWKSYFRWRILTGQVVALPKEFRYEDFFWDAQERLQESTPRWKQCAAITDEAFDEALAQAWVKRNLTPAQIAGAERLVPALENALGGEIRGLPWMSEETKKTAAKKLAAIRNHIGHPERWRDYSALTVDRHDFIGDLHRSAVFQRDYRLSKLGKPVDPEEWDLAATALQTRYVRSTNSLYIPAGLIQPPFFDSTADPAVNFAGIGVLAARELTHGFDTLGSKYDERGNVHDWWSPRDRAQFDEATSCVAAPISEGMPRSEHDAPPIHLPAAESNAENGGLRIAYRALMDALVAQGKTADNPIDGYTESQRFFLSFAQNSCESIRPTHQRQSAHSHSVGQVRVNGAVQNFEEFGKAFRCTKGKPMYPEKSCRVW
jgi:putative endopeptidase